MMSLIGSVTINNKNRIATKVHKRTHETTEFALVHKDRKTVQITT